MIGQRYATQTRTGPRPHSAIAPPALTSPAQTHATREYGRVAQSLGQSVPVQLALILSLLAFAAMVYMFQASQVDVLQMNISALQSHAVQAQADNAALESRATYLQSIRRITAIATKQLHMAPVDPNAMVWIFPVIPPTPQTHDVNADLRRVQQASQPLAWVGQFAAAVRSAL